MKGRFWLLASVAATQGVANLEAELAAFSAQEEVVRKCHRVVKQQMRQEASKRTLPITSGVTHVALLMFWFSYWQVEAAAEKLDRERRRLRCATASMQELAGYVQQKLTAT